MLLTILPGRQHRTLHPLFRHCLDASRRLIHPWPPSGLLLWCRPSRLSRPRRSLFPLHRSCRQAARESMTTSSPRALSRCTMASGNLMLTLVTVIVESPPSLIRESTREPTVISASLLSTSTRYKPFGMLQTRLRCMSDSKILEYYLHFILMRDRFLMGVLGLVSTIKYLFYYFARGQHEWASDFWSWGTTSSLKLL